MSEEERELGLGAGSGGLSLEGKDPEVHGFSAWRAKVAYVFQGRVSLRGTVREHFLKCRGFAAHRELLAQDLSAGEFQFCS